MSEFRKVQPGLPGDRGGGENRRGSTDDRYEKGSKEKEKRRREPQASISRAKGEGKKWASTKVKWEREGAVTKLRETYISRPMSVRCRGGGTHERRK